MITINQQSMTPCRRIFEIVAQRQRPLAVVYPNGQRIIVVPEGMPHEHVLPTDGVDVVNSEGEVVQSLFPKDIEYDIFFSGSIARA